jgi:hypothetical protein
VQQSFSSTLASTNLGQVRYCACKDRVAMRFKERWFGMARTELPGFRDSLVQLLDDPALIRRLIGEALEQAASRGLPATCLPTLEELGEMLALLDTAMLVLEAQDIAGAAMDRGGPA